MKSIQRVLHCSRVAGSMAGALVLGSAGATALEAPAGFLLHEEARPLPATAFTDGDGQQMTLADFHGRVVLLNLWATWCAPCRREMPTLERLQAELGGPDFQVVALSLDRKGLPVVQEFYTELGLERLPIYVDASGEGRRDLSVLGLPTTLLLDRDGREIGRLLGPAEWDSPEMVGFLREYLERSATGGGREWSPLAQVDRSSSRRARNSFRPVTERTLARYQETKKVSVLHFVHTRCPDLCPLHAELIGDMPELVQFVTVPTDPEHDTPDVMRDRSSADRVDPTDGIFLTGGLDRPEDTTRKLLAAAVPYGPSGTLGPAGAALRTCSGVSNCYVCSTDSCTFSGSWQSRIENAAPGDTILLRSGTYTPSGGLSIPGGAANGKIVIANYNGSAVVIAGPISIGGGHVLMEGVTVNSPGSSDAIHIESWTSTVKQDIELKNMDVLGGTGEAIRIQGNVRDLTIRNSLLDGGRDNHTIKVLCDNAGSCSLIPENCQRRREDASPRRSKNASRGVMRRAPRGALLIR